MLKREIWILIISLLQQEDLVRISLNLIFSKLNINKQSKKLVMLVKNFRVKVKTLNIWIKKKLINKKIL